MSVQMRILCILLLFCTSITFAKNQHQAIDSFILQTMKTHNVPAISIAIINQERIVYAQVYSIDINLKLNKATLFQAASVGKAVAAYGALLLVKQGKLALDVDVNEYLRSWKIPDNPYTSKRKVTLRNILDMTSGLSVSGFWGKSVNEVQPSLKQILHGQPPAENKPVIAQFTPGTQYFYSGGSFEVLEQMIEDVTHMSFSEFMQRQVLGPLNMINSQFTAILPKALWSKAIPGFLKDGRMIDGRWKIIAALAAGGMWTTPTDLAKFAINVMKSYQGRQGLISKKLAREMLTRQKNTDFGLGFVISGCGKNLNFRKEGHNIGFYNWLIAFPETGQGVVVMTNSENGIPAIQVIIQKIAEVYHWPDFYPIVDEFQQIPEDCASSPLTPLSQAGEGK